MDKLLSEIAACRICEAHLPLGPNPVVTASPTSRIMIVGQAPGTAVHETGIAWNDPSGDRLRSWMDINKDIFYDTSQIALVPMAFCYPGRGKSGDLPPRKECAPQWHSRIVDQMNSVQLFILAGQYAHAYYLGHKRKKTLTDTVRNFEEYMPKYFVLPHPSPRNNIWMAKNPWFEQQVVPSLKSKVAEILKDGS